MTQNVHKEVRTEVSLGTIFQALAKIKIKSWTFKGHLKKHFSSTVQPYKHFNTKKKRLTTLTVSLAWFSWRTLWSSNWISRNSQYPLEAVVTYRTSPSWRGRSSWVRTSDRESSVWESRKQCYHLTYLEPSILKRKTHHHTQFDKHIEERNCYN